MGGGYKICFSVSFKIYTSRRNHDFDLHATNTSPSFINNFRYFPIKSGMNLVPVINLQTVPHIVHQSKVSLTCVAGVERGKREGALPPPPPPPSPCPFSAFHGRLNSVAEQKENVGRAEWTPRLGEWSWDLKYTSFEVLICK